MCNKLYCVHSCYTIRTAAACSTFLSNGFLSRRTDRACRSNTTPRPTTWRGRFLVRPPRSRGPPPRSRYSPSAGVEPQSAGTHSNITRIKSNHMRLGTHALSLHPPLRAQMSAARGACGRAELALRRRCVGCPAGGAAPRAKGLSGRLARERRCGAAALVNLRAEWSPPALAPAGPG